MKFRTSDGLELYFELSGRGTPCVYLHGGPGYWSKSFQHFSRELLEDDLEMIYLDQRGCGRSEHSSTYAYSLNRLVDDLEELRLKLEIKKWLVMGHSFGGILAVNYAHRFPERTSGLILSNVTLNMYHSFTHQIKIGSDLLAVEVNDLPTENLSSFMNSYYSILTQLLQKEVYFKFQYTDIKNKKKVDLIDQEGLESDPNFQQYVFTSNEYFQDFTLLCNEISKPVLIIAGEYDHAVGPNHHKLFHFPESEIQILKSSHHPYMENQLEFKNAILRFIAG